MTQDPQYFMTYKIERSLAFHIRKVCRVEHFYWRRDEKFSCTKWFSCIWKALSDTDSDEWYDGTGDCINKEQWEIQQNYPVVLASSNLNLYCFLTTRQLRHLWRWWLINLFWMIDHPALFHGKRRWLPERRSR
jgi:hypothetical protein